MSTRPSAGPVPDSPLRVALARAALLFGFWIILMPSAKPGDLAVGAFTAAAATWLSLRLLPPAAGGLRFGPLLALLPRFLWQSVLAGFDVARRVFDPRLPLRTGLVKCPLGFPPGLTRNTFATITSLLPGTLPLGDDEDGVLVYHCLDIGQPVAEQLGAEAQALERVLVLGKGRA